MKINKIFLINLKDRIHRWERFKIIHTNIERFDAIDSRNDFRISEKYNLKLKPVSLADKLYFSQTSGAVGAYCSHYLVWKKIVENDLESALVLEDDAYVDDVIQLLQKNLEYDKYYDLYQFNKRWHHPINYYMNFDGLECYLITNRGARILIEATHNREHFNGKVISGPLANYERNTLENSELFLQDTKQDWSIKNTISCAVDKLVGFCAWPDLDKNKKLKIKFNPCVSVYNQNNKSDISLEQLKAWRKSSEVELKQFLQSNYFEYWNHNLFSSLNNIPNDSVEFSFLTTSMNRCKDLKETYFKNIYTACNNMSVRFEFVLLNFNSTDDIDDWISKSNFSKYCRFTYIKTKKHKYFNMSKAKNIVGRYAVGDKLCWLDADNLLTPTYIHQIQSYFSKEKNRIYVAPKYNRNKKGICGRVVCKKNHFMEIGGYDETFDGWGYEDIDFTKRLEKVGIKNKECDAEHIHIQSNYNNKFINYEDKFPMQFKNNSAMGGFRVMSNYNNFLKSVQNMENGKIVANAGKIWGDV